MIEPKQDQNQVEQTLNPGAPCQASRQPVRIIWDSVDIHYTNPEVLLPGAYKNHLLERVPLHGYDDIL